MPTKRSYKELQEEMGIIIFGSIIITIIVIAMTYWVTYKAYSRKWENDPDERRGQF